MDKIKKIKFGDVDLTKPHFAISWGSNNAPDSYELIMVLNTAATVDQMRVFLLVHDIKYEQAIKEVQNEISYYLYGLNNPDPIGYLIHYHCRSLANAYSNVRFSFVEKIHKNNILYYLLNRTKQLNIYNNSSATNMQRRYFEISVDQLVAVALDRNGVSNVVDYNKDLFDLYELIFCKIPMTDNFIITDTFTIVEFSGWLNRLKNIEFCNILIYLKKIKLIKHKETERYLKLFYMNNKQHQKVTTCH